MSMSNLFFEKKYYNYYIADKKIIYPNRNIMIKIYWKNLVSKQFDLLLNSAISDTQFNNLLNELVILI